MRIKSHWFKPGKTHGPEEVADGLAFNLWRIADNALRNTRKADFEIEVGPQYLDFMAEFMVFLILSADRIAWMKLDADERARFTERLANRCGATWAENRGRLLHTDEAACKQDFIDLLNRRAGEYADFGYDENGPDYGFYRYLAWCIGQILSEDDARWAIDSLISFEAPEALALLERNLRGLWAVPAEAG